MANSKYEYVKQFEDQTRLLPSTYIVVRIDGKGFTKFCENHKYEKPNDLRGAQLMSKAAEVVMENFKEIWMAYGQSDEYSFVFRRNCNLFNRRAEKISTNVVSCFTSAFVLNFHQYFPDDKLTDVPMFDGRCVCYPNNAILQDYFSWRQVDCHINNLYNTCFWCLVLKSKMTTDQAHAKLRGTYSDYKNEMLFKDYEINYAKIEPIWRKGTTLIRIPYQKEPGVNPKEVEQSKENKQEGQEKSSADQEEVKSTENTQSVETSEDKKQQKSGKNRKDGGEKKMKVSPPKMKWRTEQVYEDIIGPEFWEKYKESVFLE